VAVAKALTAHDGPLAAGRILVAGGPAERAAALPLIKAFDSDDVIDLVDRTDLLTLAACIGKAELFIGNDSGLMHLSAAVGTTTLGLFGPSRDDHYRPWGDDNMAVRSAQTYAALMPGGHPQAHDICLMTGLSVATVTTAARAQLSCRIGVNAGNKYAPLLSGDLCRVTLLQGISYTSWRLAFLS
jgi:ADP-heptose:LPS heptosyltransferase